MIISATIRFDKLLGETPKACLVKVYNNQYWIPKSLCRNFIINKKLGGSVVLPTFVINRMLSLDINHIDSLPSFITPYCEVEYHLPKHREPETDNTIKELKR